MEKLKLAILDMYDNEPNQGMRAIKEIVDSFGKHISWELFNIRGKCEIPSLDFDLYISTGGPGDPLVGDGIWDKQYYAFIDELWEWNKYNKDSKKYAFFICHSFQMICQHFKIAQITKRKSRSFGTFPVHKTPAGTKELFFQELADPFTVADFRDWQVVQPDVARMKALGMKILAKEKKRPHVNLERAIMAIRFSNEFFGTQFHPEADPRGMLIHFSKEEQRKNIIKEHNLKKYQQMLEDLNRSDRIQQTYRTILPTFLATSIEALATIKV